MPHNITPVSTFTAPVVAWSDGDAVAESSSDPTIQALTNRTEYLHNIALVQTIVVSANGTTVLTAASTGLQVLTGTSNQTFQLPDETTLEVGRPFTFLNQSTGIMTFKDSGGSTIYSVGPANGGRGTVPITWLSSSNSTANGSWLLFPTKPGQLVATSIADTAAAGSVGELIQQSLLHASALSLTNNTPVDVASITLTPGDWDIRAILQFTSGAATTVFYLGAISLTSATIPAISCIGVPSAGGEVTIESRVDTAAGGPTFGIIVPPIPVQVSTNTSFHLVASATFSGSLLANGWISARRVR